MGSAEVVVVPRNFQLLDELESAEHGKTDLNVSYGLVQPDDITLSNWQCSIIGPVGSVVEGRIISLLLHCGSDYPQRPPEFRFQTKLNFPFIASDGKVTSSFKLKWNSKMNMEGKMNIEGALSQLRNEFAKSEYRKLQQPAEGTCY